MAAAGKQISGKPTMARRGLSSALRVCFTISNLILIIGFVVSISICAIFLNDEPLYEYGEHLLSLTFYKQLMFVAVIVSLALAIPIATAIGIALKTRQHSGNIHHQHKQDNNKSAVKSSLSDTQYVNHNTDSWHASRPLMLAKIGIEALLIMSLIVALVLIIPSCQFSGVASQLGVEIRKHMRFRYDNDFSYQFLDTIQRQYQCCDLAWYRQNLFEKIPSSCYEPTGLYTKVFNDNCVETLAQLVCDRCKILALALAAMLAALVALLCADIALISRCASSGGRTYDLGAAEDSHYRRAQDEEPLNEPQRTMSPAHSIHTATPTRITTPTAASVADSRQPTGNLSRQKQHSSASSHTNSGSEATPRKRDQQRQANRDEHYIISRARRDFFDKPRNSYQPSDYDDDDDDDDDGFKDYAYNDRRDSNIGENKNRTQLDSQLDNEPLTGAYQYRRPAYQQQTRDLLTPGLAPTLATTSASRVDEPLLSHAHFDKTPKPARYSTRSTTTELIEERKTTTSYRQPIGRTTSRAVSPGKKSISFLDEVENNQSKRDLNEDEEDSLRSSGSDIVARAEELFSSRKIHNPTSIQSSNVSRPTSRPTTPKQHILPVRSPDPMLGPGSSARFSR